MSNRLHHVLLLVTAMVIGGCAAQRAPEQGPQARSARPVDAQERCRKERGWAFTRDGKPSRDFVRDFSACMARLGYKHAYVKYDAVGQPRFVTGVKEYIQ